MAGLKRGGERGGADRALMAEGERGRVPRSHFAFMVQDMLSFMDLDTREYQA